MPRRKRKVGKALSGRVSKLENILTKTFERKIRDFSLVDLNSSSLTPDDRDWETL